ncbi:trypsin-like peptidase domain-containing protein [Geomonas anaerohicana]|uniref:Trypsin-like peptidase domain-containing protein n=1 Tax=Geomonas anaerohicana TaxID=2798583 RepID=A0ABS0YF92_9BACT|nr:trypsin-like peptidase domain-containing protein [Geomonas anaerohicana]MBJ6750976.1 trypsin-like peptidase domain-containing protein [Geomonas anaerohicana]
MNLVKSYKEIVHEQIKNGAANAGKKYKNAIRPIYGSEENGKPVHIGTCVLVEIGGKRYLITAAHVVDESRLTSLYIGGTVGSKLLLIEGEFMCTTKPKGDRDLDHYDFAWLELSQQQLKQLEGVSFVAEVDIASQRTDSEKRAYVVMGYPNTKNKEVDFTNMSITPRFARYTATGKKKPKMYNKLKISGESHIVVEHKKRSVDSDGNITASIHPRGMSGGAFIDLGGLVSLEELAKQDVNPGLLAGIFIEKHREFNAMLSVRIEIIIDTIKANT